MKIYILLFMMLLGFGSTAIAESVMIGKMKTDVWNELFEEMNQKDLWIRHNIDEETIDIYLEDSLRTYVITIEKEQRYQLLSYIEKFQQWVIKAREKKVKLDKEIGVIEREFQFKIGKSSLTGPDIKYIINEKTYSEGGVGIYTSFFTQPNMEYQFVISFSAIDNKPRTRYLSVIQTVELESLLNQKTIDKAVEKYLDEKANAAEFN